jgi:hypothetical protein
VQQLWFSTVKLLFMPTLSWWYKKPIEYKERAVKVLNGEAFSLGVVNLPGLRSFNRFQKGLLTPDESRAFRKLMQKHWQSEQDAHNQLAEILKWRAGAPLPSDIRRCRRYPRCEKFFLVGSRAKRLYYCASQKCGGNYRSLKSMNKKKRRIAELKLKRVRLARKIFGHLPDWKERTAKRAQVTPNFISYAIRRGEL